jgi:hypothetical protein
MKGYSVESYIKAIEKCDVDRFRPLINYINKRTSDTADMNVELLAWLIDFKPRPFELWKKTDAVRKEDKDPTKEELLGGGVSAMEGNKIGDEVNSNIEHVEAKEEDDNKKRWLFFLIPILLLAVIGYKWISDYKIKKEMTGSNSCMYWTGDHYERISCLQREDTLVVPFDQKKVSNFQRILNTDTVTERSIGKLWYRKKDNKLEIYTSGGYHPVDVRIKLKVLNEYMFKKYLKKPTP